MIAFIRDARAQPFANPRKPYTLKRRLAVALEWLYAVRDGEHSDDELLAVMRLAAQAAIARREHRADPRLPRS